jgi:hypothetical protein
LRRVHDLRNKLTELELVYEAEKRAAWEDDPDVAPVLAAVAETKAVAEAAWKELAAVRQRGGHARKRKEKTALAAALAEQQDHLAAAAWAAARRPAAQARQELRLVKASRWPARQHVSLTSRVTPPPAWTVGQLVAVH